MTTATLMRCTCGHTRAQHRQDEEMGFIECEADDTCMCVGFVPEILIREETADEEDPALPIG